MSLPGYDNWKLATPPYYDTAPVDEDEGIIALQSAMAYLKTRSDADYSEQETGEFEAYTILEDAISKIRQLYECKQCGRMLNSRGGWCSARCRAAYDL